MTLRVLGVLTSALLLNLVAPPPNLHGLHWFALVPAFLAMRKDRYLENALLGFLFGFLTVGSLFRWLVGTISIFSNLPAPLAWIVLAGFAAAYGAPWAAVWPMARAMRDRIGPVWTVCFAAWVVVIEYASMYLLLFPYQQGVSQYQNLGIWQLASVTGVWGLSFLVVWSNAAIAELIYRHQDYEAFPTKTLLSPLVAITAVTLWGNQRFAQIEAELAKAPVVRVAQFQSSHGMEWRMQNGSRAGFNEWLSWTSALQPGQADLVVWPEGACPYPLNEVPRRRNVIREKVSQLAQDKQVTLIAGAGTRRREPDADAGEDRVRVFNSVYTFTNTGESLGAYDKIVPLPFGEYLPFGKYMPGVAEMIGGIGDFKAGTEAVIFQTAVGALATPICYEAILPRTTRLFRDADILVNVTNDAWFGDTGAPSQHAMLAVIRSTELGVPMIRSAYSGSSMIVEPHGVMHSVTQPFTEVKRIVPMRNWRTQTVYGKLGDWFPALCFGISIAGLWVGRRR